MNRQRQTLKPLKTLGFSVCLYYTVRAHLRYPGPAKWGGRENRLFHSRPLQRWFHPGHLRPRHHHRPAGGSQENGRGFGAEGAVRKIPGAGMRRYPLQNLTQISTKPKWVKSGSTPKGKQKPPQSRKARRWLFPVNFSEKTVLFTQQIPPNWSDVMAVSHKKARKNPR